MDEGKLIMFRNRLTKVFRHTGKQAKRLNVSCYRLYDHDLPEFPFCIEFYGDKLYVAEYKRRHQLSDADHDTWMEKSIAVIEEVLQVDRDDIFLKLRQRKPGRLGQYQKYGEVQHEFVVEENGLKFMVNLSDYLDTGLFLDHRVTRQLLKEQCNGMKVLNLFAYTGSFSVYAAAGGAVEVLTVDLSNTYLEWAKRNFQLNGFEEKTGENSYRFLRADVKQYLKTIPAETFDLIVMDPPTFSNSKRMKDILDIQRDHVVLINEAVAGLKKDGCLYFSTNARKFELNRKEIRSTSIKDITKITTAFDFEGKLHRYCFLITR